MAITIYGASDDLIEVDGDMQRRAAPRRDRYTVHELDDGAVEG